VLRDSRGRVQRDRRQHLVRGTAEHCEHPQPILPVTRLAEHLRAGHDDRVRAEHRQARQPRRGRAGAQRLEHGLSLALRQALHALLDRLPGEPALRDRRGPYPMRHLQLREQRAAPRRGRRQYDARAVAHDRW
jgi:hypothetical protein